MDKGSTVDGTTDTRRLLRALRPVLVLGGFVLMWWLLATGAAQASDGAGDGKADLSTTAGSLARSVDQVVAHHEHRAAPRAHRAPRPVTKVTRTVRHHVAPVTTAVTTSVKTTVKTTVAKTPVAPVVKAATKTVRTVVAPVVKQAHEALESAPVVPVVTGPHGVTPEATTPVVESSAPAHKTTSHHAAPRPVAHRPANDHPTTSAVTPSHAVATVAPSELHAAPAAPADAPLGQTPNDHQTATTGSAAATSSQSGSGAAPGAALFETGPTHLHDLAGTVVPATSDGLDAGPAYPPSSSPD